MQRIGFLFLIMLVAAPALAASGIKGRTAWRGEVVAGLRVRAYRAIADIPAGTPVATSAPTAKDGTFALELAPGSYYLTARNYTDRPAPGDYFCYYSGAPVRVRSGHFSVVGFNLIKIPAEAAPAAAPASGISGEVSFQGKPLGHSYLYVYKTPADGFKGPGYFIQPIATGSFRLRLPPGDYWLLVRKRRKGGRYGPIEPGDYFNYYFGNPVHIAPGLRREVKIEAVTRLAPPVDEAAAFSGIQGRVVGADGRPVAGLYVFGYREAKMTGTPAAFSDRTGADGMFHLSLPEDGTWYLLARQSFGGPAADDELYGRYGGRQGTPVHFGPDQTLPEVTIHVARKLQP